MFNLPRDVVVTMTEGLVNVQDVGIIGKGFQVAGDPKGMVMADFNGDGFADIALFTANDVGSTSGLLRIVTANNLNNLNDGLFLSNGVGPFLINFAIDLSITADDFNGDGKAKVAIAQPAPLNGGEVLIYIYEVITNQNGAIANQALQQVASLTVAVNGVAEVALTAGDYDGVKNATTGLPDDELIIAYRFGANLAMNSLDVVPDSNNPNNYQLIIKGNTLLSTVLDTDSNVIAGLGSGRLDWFGSTEQVVVAFNSQGAGFASVFTFDSALNFQGGGSVSFLPLKSMALGNYAQALGQNDPPNQEIALLMADFFPTPGSFQLAVYQVEPSNNFALSLASQSHILPGLSPFENSALFLVAGDTQGRSLLLGPPEKVTVTNHIQPDTILGVPPMHVDWITPAGESAPGVLNVSVFPASFNSQYNFQDTTGNQASRKSTTSYTVATKEAAEEKISYGVPGIDSVSVPLKQATTQTHKEAPPRVTTLIRDRPLSCPRQRCSTTGWRRRPNSSTYIATRSSDTVSP